MTRDIPQDLYKAKVNLETAQIAWKELQRLFAGGVVLMISRELDLVEVAFQISKDNVGLIRGWAEQGKLLKVSDTQAASWFEDDALVWAVVASPWVLVQPADKLQ
ncbi:MAG: DUF2288 domain-containing protein [Gallionella sp.]